MNNNDRHAIIFQTFKPTRIGNHVAQHWVQLGHHQSMIASISDSRPNLIMIYPITVHVSLREVDSKSVMGPVRLGLCSASAVAERLRMTTELHTSLRLGELGALTNSHDADLGQVRQVRDATPSHVLSRNNLPGKLENGRAGPGSVPNFKLPFLLDPVGPTGCSLLRDSEAKEVRPLCSVRGYCIADND